MGMGRDKWWTMQLAVALIFGILLTACSGGGADERPRISITQPTSESTYQTPWSEVRIGGSISRASFVQVTNSQTGSAIDGYVFYFEAGHGSWFADIPGLVPGENLLTATAGSGSETAKAHITVIRPQQPAMVIINGSDSGSAMSFWTDVTSIGEGHKIVLFTDGTGRATTGNLLMETAGSVTDFTWILSAPDAIQIAGCATCSFQKISRISGSIEEGTFYGQIETVGGAGELASHVFLLSSGSLSPGAWQ